MVWETLVNLVCRPPRFIYDPDVALGPQKFRIDGKIFERKDLDVRGPVLLCDRSDGALAHRTATTRFTTEEVKS